MEEEEGRKGDEQKQKAEEGEREGKYDRNKGVKRGSGYI